MTPEIQTWAGLRCHVLIPHDVVGSVIDGSPTWGGLTVDTAGTYWRDKKAILSVSRHERDGATCVVVRAFTDVWLQEPGLTVKIAGDGIWHPIHRGGKAGRGYVLHQKDAHRSTVHFSRVQTSPEYTVAVEYREAGTRYRFTSDGGFTRLLDTPAGQVPWQGCQVFGEGYELDGTVSGPQESLRRWELAGKPPNIGQMHFLGWTGGAAAVVNKDGRDVGAPGDRWLWQPKSYRRLRPGQTIAQTLEVRRL